MRQDRLKITIEDTSVASASALNLGGGRAGSSDPRRLTTLHLHPASVVDPPLGPAGADLDSVGGDHHSPRAPVQTVPATTDPPIVEIVGAVAQLGERRVRNAKVRGSIPLGSTNFPQSKGMLKRSTGLRRAMLVLSQHCR